MAAAINERVMMGVQNRLAAAACVAALAATGTSAEQRDLGREILAANDGFASLGEGVTGGADADADHVFVVRNRAALAAALAAGPAGASRIVYVDGTIDANVDEENNQLTCEDYYRGGYTLDGFLDFYNPEGPWGPNAPANMAGSLEAARRLSAAAQSARIRMRVPDNTTIVGTDARATLRGAWLDLRGTATARRRNIIIRNIMFEDVYDCFPAWTPTRNPDASWAGTGSWDSEYDAISLRETERVWIAHNEFRDRETVDSTLPRIFGAKYQIHDGLVDITNASDRVTVSWNRFLDHDKTMLIGSSDNAPADVGRLRVTLHHNLFENLGQRVSRVRCGQVHVYNNYYVIPDADVHGYSWGVGVQPLPVSSGIFAENNFFRTDKSVTPDQFISRFTNGHAIVADGTLLNAASENHGVDPLAEYNAVREPDLLGDVGWVPSLFLGIDPTHRVPSLVESGAGPFNW
jgi:pectate lyase